jgi:hypothetical protein
MDDWIYELTHNYEWAGMLLFIAYLLALAMFGRHTEDDPGV